jgi:threonine dehydratase
VRTKVRALRDANGRSAAPEAYLMRHLAAIEAAAARIHPHVHPTPLLTNRLDPALLLKPEYLQVTGSFKARGAFNALLKLREGDSELAGAVAVSSGNHAQAVAHACRALRLNATIVVPEDASRIKMHAARELGGEILSDGVTFANREERARTVAAERGLPLVHSFDDWDVIHGQGTIGLELRAERPDIGLVAAPIGGGGLLSGVALALKAYEPRTYVVGIEPEAAADAARSFASGAIDVLPEPPTTIADGLRVVSIGQRPFEVMVERGLVDEIVTVSESEIEAALIAAWTRLDIPLEPTGALPLAAYFAGKLPKPPRGRVAALILSGGNYDPELVSTLVPQKTGVSRQIPQTSRSASHISPIVT